MGKAQTFIDKDFTLRVEERKSDIPKNNEGENKNLLLAKYANVGYYVVTPLFVGVFLGVAMDHWLNTKPFFTIILLLLGVVSTFYNLYQLTQDKF